MRSGVATIRARSAAAEVTRAEVPSPAGISRIMRSKWGRSPPMRSWTSSRFRGASRLRGATMALRLSFKGEGSTALLMVQRPSSRSPRSKTIWSAMPSIRSMPRRPESNSMSSDDCPQRAKPSPRPTQRVDFPTPPLPEVREITWFLGEAPRSVSMPVVLSDNAGIARYF